MLSASACYGSISFARGALQQTRRTPLLLSIDGTDGQMLGRFIDLAAHAMRAVLVADTSWRLP